ncbi:LamG-like jellyroll fold domain-containing protein [Verrucomicrobiota bacterium]
MRTSSLFTMLMAIVLLITFPFLGVADLTNGLVLHYTFDSDEGGTVTDQSGNGNIGIVTGATWTASGKIGGAMDFSGIGDCIRVNDADILSFTDGAGNDQPFSVSVWAYFDEANNGPLLFKKESGLREWSFNSAGSGGPAETLQFGVFHADESANVMRSTAPIGAYEGQWVHLVGTYDGSEATNGVNVYINGVLQNSATNIATGSYTGMSNTTAALFLGYNLVSGYLDGKLDDVRVYNRALSAGEVAQLYHKARDGLILHYTFDSDEGDIVTDESGNGNMGTVTGATWTASGKIGGAYELYGDDDHMIASNNPAFHQVFNGQHPFTISVWYNRRKILNDKVNVLVLKGTDPYMVRLNLSPWQGVRYARFILKNGSDANSIRGYADGFNSTNSWHHLVWTYDGSGVGAGCKLYKDGVSQSLTLQNDNLVGPIVLDEPVVIGNWTNEVGNMHLLDGKMDDVRIYSRALSAVEVSRLYHNGEDGLVLRYTFDSDEGGIVTDQSGNGHIGTVVSATWTASGKIAGAMNFDGTNDFVDVGDTDSLSFGDGTNDSPFSVSVWVRRSSTNGVDELQGLVSKYMNDGSGREWDLQLYRDTGQFNFLVYDNSAGSAQSRTSQAMITDTNWHHIVAIYDGRGGNSAHEGIKLYLDGTDAIALVGHTQTPYVSMENVSAPVHVGQYGAASGSGKFYGNIDGVRVYNRALSVDKVFQLYQSGDDGLILHYTFDSDEGDIVTDESGNGNMGTVTGATWTASGKIGGAYELYGDDDHMIASNNPAFHQVFNGQHPFTISVWYNRRKILNDKVNVLVLKGTDPYMVRLNLSPWQGVRYARFILKNGSDANSIRGYADGFNSTNSWHHLVWTYDGSGVGAGCKLYKDGVSQSLTLQNDNLVGPIVLDEPVVIGNWTNEVGNMHLLDGKMDDVRIYNRALSAGEVSHLYQKGDDGLVLHYTFDSDEGEIVTDQSGNGNIGIVTGATWTASGKIGGAMSFDGTNDFIKASDADVLSFTDGAGNDKPFTVSVWAYFDEANNGPLLFKKESGLREWSFNSAGPGGPAETLQFGVFHTDESANVMRSTAPIGAYEGQWVHLVGTYDGSEATNGMNVYINGVLQDSATNIETGSYTGMSNTTATLFLGWNLVGGYLDGKLDDVRVYNRALSSFEVMRLCNRSPVADVSVSSTNGPAPLLVTFDLSGSSDPDTDIVRWEIDREGDGMYEISGEGLGSVVVEYPEPGSFTTSVKVVDDYGASGSTSVVIEVWGAPPVADLQVIPSNTIAGTAVTLTGTNSTAAAGHEIVVYEFDVDGDGNYEMTVTNGVISWTYREPGLNTAVLRVTDDQGLQSADSETVTVSVVTNPPAVFLSASPDEGNVPLDVVLTANTVDDGTIVSFEWDFDGDGDCDIITTTNIITNTYTLAGSYAPGVTVIDNDGLSGSASIVVHASEASALKAWISTPKMNWDVSGAEVTVHANTAPGNLTGSVLMQYKKSSDSVWIDIGSVIVPPPYSFKTTWDVSGLVNAADYDLRAKATDISSNIVYSQIVTVQVYSAWNDEIDDIEEADVGGKHTRKQKCSKNKTTTLDIYDNTSVILPVGTVNTDPTVNIVLTDGNTNPVNGAAVGTISIGKNRKVSIDGNPSLNKPITIIIPYDDVDDDGIVDGLGISETVLIPYWYDTESGQWKRVLSFEVHATANYIKAITYHLTEFGVFGSKNILRPGNGGVLESFTSEYTNTMSAVNLADGNKVSFWRSELNPSGPQTFVYSFTNSESAVITMAGINNCIVNGYESEDFEIQASINGSSYWSLTNGTLAANESLQEFDFGSVTCRFVKLIMSSGADAQAWDVAEFGVHGQLTNDVDADGLQDAWEVQYFDDLSRDGTLDYDNDDLSDLGEYQNSTCPTNTDSDGDGMTDGWEVDNSLDPQLDDSSDDADGDGMSNLEELIAGTHPNNSSDLFEIDDLPYNTTVETNIVIGWEMVSGRFYSVYSKTNLMDSFWFTNIHRMQSISNGVMSFTNAIEGKGKFFRIGVENE